MISRTCLSRAAIWSAALSIASGVTSVRAEAPAAAIPRSDSLAEVVVTARRREESAQTVPVSVTAFSADALAQRNIREVQDLNVVVPGFRFGSEGGKNSNNVSLRGLARISVGEGLPAVVTYFADVPLSGDGTNIPTYDLAGIQVLKGPQGTLFGRNTLGGALLIAPKAPSYDVEGYVRGTVGRFDYHQLEGALNIPLQKDVAAIRIAGQTRRADGYTKNLNNGPDFDDVNQDSVRISLLLEPFEGLKNTTIYDWFRADEQPGALYLYQHNPGVIRGLSGLIDAQLASYAAAQRAVGPYKVFSDMGNRGEAYRSLWGITNNTTAEVGSITFRNIFGYRQSKNRQTINTGANGPLTITPAPGLTLPFTLFTASSSGNRSYLTDELQMLGKSFDDKLDWIVGAFYNHDHSIGPGGSNFVAFSSTGAQAFTTSHAESKNYAVFAQGGLDLSSFGAQGFTLNLGFRYSWDKVNGCGGSFAGGYVTQSVCERQGALGLADGVGVITNEGQKPSWTIGLDYKLSDQVFLYAVSRRGYRNANINTPLFETPFTTGGTGCNAPGGRCPDLRPFQKIDEETLTDFEMGIKTDWTAGDVRGRINLAGFWSKYKNALQFFNVVAVGIPQGTPDFPTRQSIGINAADETIKGLELEATIVPIDGLTFSFTGAYTDSKVDKVSIPPIGGLTLTKKDITLPTPKFAGTLGVNWVLPVHPLEGDVVFNADYFHTDKFGAQVGRFLPKYDVVNTRLAWNGIAGTRVDTAFYVKNLFEEKYFISPSNLLLSFPTNSVYAGAPRTWGFEVQYSF